MRRLGNGLEAEALVPRNLPRVGAEADRLEAVDARLREQRLEQLPPAPLPRRLGTTAIVSSGVFSSTKPKPGSSAVKSRYHAAPYECGPSTATTPASPGLPQLRT